jgi:hypothetical protein
VKFREETVKIYNELYTFSVDFHEPRADPRYDIFSSYSGLALTLKDEDGEGYFYQRFTQQNLQLDHLAENYLILKDTLVWHLRNKYKNKTRKIMNYKTIKYILAVESTNELLEFSTEEDMNDKLEVLLEKNSKSKIKILTVTGVIAPKKRDLSKLIVSV